MIRGGGRGSIYYYNKKINVTVDNNVLLEIGKAFPSNIKVKDLVEKFGDDAYDTIAVLMLVDDIEIFSEPLTLVKTDKPKLKPEIVRYFHYFLENDRSYEDKSEFSHCFPINISSFLNEDIGITGQLDLKIFLLFDGTRTQADVVRYLTENYHFSENPDPVEERNYFEKLVNSIFERMYIFNLVIVP
ncbi:hypothetical protein CFY87_08325 [Actinobacillus seminis]|uniref:Uncharacterized protein n=2 Tax=Actinobacillus seminis TaxID=722 RepID=A0A263HBX1_9PAST|nr:hypothetical protein CFY87_08325 [Actinobacillus seminis]SUU38413.1 Uncharacterised protein [Actinobacillus seminis]